MVWTCSALQDIRRVDMWSSSLQANYWCKCFEYIKRLIFVRFSLPLGYNIFSCFSIIISPPDWWFEGSHKLHELLFPCSVYKKAICWHIWNTTRLQVPNKSTSNGSHEEPYQRGLKSSTFGWNEKHSPRGNDKHFGNWYITIWVSRHISLWYFTSYSTN